VWKPGIRRWVVARRLCGVPERVGTLELLHDLVHLEPTDAVSVDVGGGKLSHRLEHRRPIAVTRVRTPRRPRSHRRLLTLDRVEHPIEIGPSDQQLPLDGALGRQRPLRNPQPDGGGVDAQLLRDLKAMSSTALIKIVTGPDVIRPESAA
jgi:hypothetical protein